MFGMRMFGYIRQRFLANVEEGNGLCVTQLLQSIRRTGQVDVQQCVGAEFCHQPLNTLHQVFIMQVAGTQI